MSNRLSHWGLRVAILLGAPLVLLAAGCWNPVKRDPVNVFPGQPGYDKRVATFNLNEEQARELALAAARRDGRPEYVGNRPTVVHGKEYVFSLPIAEGASLKGYHVNGEKATVRFFFKDTTVQVK